MSEGTGTAEDRPAEPTSGGIDSATPTARQASSMALLGVVVVLVLIAIAGVWWYVTSAGAAAEAEAREKIRKLGAVVVPTAKDKPAKTVNLSLPAAHENIDAIVEEIPDLVYLTNLNVRDAPLTDEHLARIGELDSLLALDLTDTAGNSKITDAGMPHLTGLDNLTSLDLYGTKVTEKGLESVGKLHGLKILNIGKTQVRGDLSELLPLTNLEWLVAGDMELSDEAIATLGELPKLVKLTIHGATVSEAALAKLRDKKPEIMIDH